MAQAKLRLLFLITLVSFGLFGCVAAPLVAMSLGGTELATSHVTSGMKVTGAELRQGADFSNTYPKHIQMKLALDHSDWTCYRGKGSYAGQELCLLPTEAKKFNNNSWFQCRIGRGGQIVQMATREYGTYYCTLQPT